VLGTACGNASPGKTGAVVSVVSGQTRKRGSQFFVLCCSRGSGPNRQYLRDAAKGRPDQRLSELQPPSTATSRTNVFGTESEQASRSVWGRFQERRAKQAFRRAARRDHLKHCPSCYAMIQKDGGCDHMKCHCGHEFSWDNALTVVPCNKVHWDGQGFPGMMWGKTCKNCTCLAKGKLVALRTGVAVGCVPAAAVGAVAVVAGAAVAVAGATVVTVVPAVVCAPLALAYEPVRMLTGKKKNVLAKGMFAGCHAVGFGMLVAAMMCDGLGDDD